MRPVFKSALPFACPSPPDWEVDWPACDEQFQWIRRMRDCAQNPDFHGEGDVWTHVRMVCEALADLTEWRELSEDRREILFAAALLHDVAKPACTRWEDGRIVSRGHSQRGAIDSRRILWELGSDFAARERVCALVRYHQAPFHLIERPDAQRLAFLISQSVSCELLTILAKADVLGREHVRRADLIERIELFREYCREQNCLEGPRAFASSYSRFLYFQTPGRDPSYLAHEDAKCEAILMCGLPGSGKDTWIKEHASQMPEISLDVIRAQTGAPPVGNQGPVIQSAREQARVYLRAGRDFVWNATNLARERRQQLIDLFTAYRARTRIVYVEAGPERLWKQNEQRAAMVPVGAIERMMEHWEVPAVVEAPGVECWVNGRSEPAIN